MKQAFILAGGRSSRFGSDKTALRRDGRLVIADVVAMLQEHHHDVTILGPNSDHLASLACRVISDEVTFDGALPAIITAFDLLACDRAIVIAADMPFLQPDVVQMMWRYEGPCNLVVLEGGIFPAIFSSSAIPVMQDQLKSGSRRLHDLHTRLSATTHVIPKSQWSAGDPEALSLRNINTPEDWRLVP